MIPGILNMQNKIFILVSFILLIVLVASCIHSDSKALSGGLKINKSENVTQVNMVGHWLGEGKREKLVREFVNEFEFVNQDIKINMKFPEDLYKDDNGEFEFIINEVTKPVSDFDIIRLKSDYPVIARMMNNENWGAIYLVDFAEVPGFIEKHLSTLNMAAIKRRTGNICVGPCLEGNYETLYANLSIAKRIGITVKQYGMTYDDLLNYLKVLDDYNKTHKTSVMAIFECADNSWQTSEPIFKRLFFSLLDGYKEINNVSYSDKKMHALEQTFKAYETLSKYNPLRDNKDRMNIDWARDNDYPLKDSCLFFVNGSYMYNIWDIKDHEALTKILPCELPVFKSSDTYIGDFSPNWCVPLNSPHRKEAIKILMYLCEPSMAEKWVRYTKCPSGIKGNLAENAFGVDAFEDFQFTINQKYGAKMIAKDDYKILMGEKNDIPLHSTLVLGGLVSAEEQMNRIRRNLIK